MKAPSILPRPLMKLRVMKRSFLTFLTSAMALVTFVATDANATVVVMHSLEEMSQRAKVIAHVRVAEQETKLVDGRIITYTGIEVIDGYKGTRSGQIFKIYQVGGTYEGRTAKIAGSHEHKVGEEMVFFGMHHRGNLVSYGVGLGKFRVEYDGAFQKVIEEIGDIVTLRKGAKGEDIFEAPTPRQPRTLKLFKSQIQQALLNPAVKKNLLKQKAFQPQLKNVVPNNQLKRVTPKSALPKGK